MLHPTRNRSTIRAWLGVAVAPLLLALAGCNQSAPTKHVLSTGTPPPSAASPKLAPSAPPTRNLSLDEAMGGHTLARHVGKTDDELRARLQRERDISSASTYTDRATAEGVVGAALALTNRSFDAWRDRTGRRPNFVLHFAADHAIGRSIRRGRRDAVACENALVVLRWDNGRGEFYVLTSYPEEHR